MPTKRHEHVEVVTDHAALVSVACELITAAAAISIGRRGFFRIALAGGGTPAPVYRALAEDRDIDWRRWQLFFGDERTVPPDHPDSNYRMVRETLIDNLPIQPLVLRVPAEADPEAAADSYASTVRKMVPGNPRAIGVNTPRFDMILLGMGGDGHTASLFPHTQALHETERWVVANPVPQLATTRITFTLPLINAARRVLFLVSGADKADMVREVLAGPQDPERLPSQSVHPTAGNLIWLVDAPAYHAIEAETADA